MKKNKIFVAGVALFILCTTGGCKKEEKTVSPPLPGNEFLTTVKLVVTNAANSAEIQTVSVKELPDQPIDYSNATLNLKINSTYHVKVYFLDETTSPAGDITKDIRERENYHLICFNATGGVDLNVNKTDLDGNTPALPVGLSDDLITGAISAGILNVQLRHQPNAKNGTCDPGSSDADVDFYVNIFN